jgi:hypothetical protein
LTQRNTALPIEQTEPKLLNEKKFEDLKLKLKERARKLFGYDWLHSKNKPYCYRDRKRH